MGLGRVSDNAGHKVAGRLKRGRDMLQMQLGHHRARRYSFQASVELTDLQSETQTREQTSDLSLFGCHVDTLKPLPPEKSQNKNFPQE